MAAAKEEEFHAQLAIYRARQAQKVKAAGAAPAEASSAHTPSPKKRAPDDIVEVLDSDDDADGNTTEGDEALARRLQAQEAAPRLSVRDETVMLNKVLHLPTAPLAGGTACSEWWGSF